jgi:hypothetical protein
VVAPEWVLLFWRGDLRVRTVHTSVDVRTMEGCRSPDLRGRRAQPRLAPDQGRARRFDTTVSSGRCTWRVGTRGRPRAVGAARDADPAGDLVSARQSLMHGRRCLIQWPDKVCVTRTSCRPRPRGRCTPMARHAHPTCVCLQPVLAIVPAAGTAGGLVGENRGALGNKARTVSYVAAVHTHDSFMFCSLYVLRGQRRGCMGNVLKLVGSRVALGWSARKQIVR